MQSMIWIGSIGGFILALVTIFKKEWSPYTVPVYAVLEGLALGAISKIYDTIYEGQGIVFMAISLTVLVLFSLLFVKDVIYQKPQGQARSHVNLN